MPKIKKTKFKTHQIHSDFTGQRITMPDGTEIFVRYFKNENATGIPIVLNDGLGCDGFAWKYLIENFKFNHPVVHWHYRGHGKSDVPKKLKTISMEQISLDLEYILDCLGIEQAIFCGHSMGVQVTLEAFSQMPNRFSGMALMCGGYKHPLKTWHASFERNGKKTLLNQAMNQIFPKLSKSFIHHSFLWQPFWKQLVTNSISFKVALRHEVNSNRILKNDFYPYFEHLGKMKVEIFAQMANSFIEHDAEHVLPAIKHPTLIVAGGKDTFSPPWLSLDMHEAIKKSDLLYIQDGSHCTPIEYPELINLRLEKFIQERIVNKNPVQMPVFSH